MPATLAETDLADRIAAAVVGARIGHGIGLPLLGTPPPAEPQGIALPEEGLPPSDGLAVLLVNLDVAEGLTRPPTCDELAAEWSERVRLVRDEYGRAVHNLSLGLLPPVSGWFNNWFLDGSAAMERALIWACAAPGRPAEAAAQAYEDAVIDHLEDGVHAAMYVAALLASAFVEREPKYLLDAAEAVVPPGSRVERAVEAVRQARRAKLPWAECARRVCDQFGHPNYSQAPQNVAFMAMAWLYGESPEDRLARAVALGGSPQVIGSIVGALTGILEGTAHLPSEWLEAASGAIAPHPDVDLDEEALSTETLVQRLTALARRSLEDGTGPVFLGPATDLEAFDPIELLDPEADLSCLDRDPREMVLRTGPVDLIVNYQGPPAIAAGGSKTLYLGALRRGAGPQRGELTLTSPSRLTVGPARPQPACPGAYFLASARGRRLPRRSDLDIHVRMEDGVEASGSFPLLGESCWWVCGPFEGGSPDDLRRPKGPERELSESTWYAGRDGTRVRFHRTSFAESHMDVEPFFDGRPGTLYLVSDWHTPSDLKASIGVAASCGVRAWLDGRPILRREDEESPLSMRNVEYVTVTLREGTHRLMLKVVRYGAPVELAVTLCDPAGRLLSEVAATEWRALGEMV